MYPKSLQSLPSSFHMIQNALACPFIRFSTMARCLRISFTFLRFRPAIRRPFQLVEDRLALDSPSNVLEAGRRDFGKVGKEFCWKGPTAVVFHTDSADFSGSGGEGGEEETLGLNKKKSFSNFHIAG